MIEKSGLNLNQPQVAPMAPAKTKQAESAPLLQDRFVPSRKSSQDLSAMKTATLKAVSGEFKPNYSSPENTLQTFYQAAKNNDLELFQSCFTKTFSGSRDDRKMDISDVKDFRKECRDWMKLINKQITSGDQVKLTDPRNEGNLNRSKGDVGGFSAICEYLTLGFKHEGDNWLIDSSSNNWKKDIFG